MTLDAWAMVRSLKGLVRFQTNSLQVSLQEGGAGCCELLHWSISGGSLGYEEQSYEYSVLPTCLYPGNGDVPDDDSQIVEKLRCGAPLDDTSCFKRLRPAPGGRLRTSRNQSTEADSYLRLRAWEPEQCIEIGFIGCQWSGMKTTHAAYSAEDIASRLLFHHTWLSWYHL